MDLIAALYTLTILFGGLVLAGMISEIHLWWVGRYPRRSGNRRVTGSQRQRKY